MYDINKPNRLDSRIFRRARYLVGRITTNGNVVEHGRYSDYRQAVYEALASEGRHHVFTLTINHRDPFLNNSNAV